MILVCSKLLVKYRFFKEYLNNLESLVQCGVFFIAAKSYIRVSTLLCYYSSLTKKIFF